MKRVKCIQTPKLTEYEPDRVYNAYIVNNGDISQINVCYEDGTDSSFSLSVIGKYFEYV